MSADRAEIIRSAHDDRPTTDIISDLRLGRARIESAFGAQLSSERIAVAQYMFDAAPTRITRGSTWRGVADGWFAGFVFEVTLVTSECVVHVEVQDGDGSIVEFVHIRLADFVAAIEQGWLVAVGVGS